MKKILYICFLATWVIVACQKDVRTDAPSADFTAINARSTSGDTLIYKLGDTCKFNITGYADNISYWAGISGNEYKHRTRTSGLGQIILSFTSQAQYGSELNTLKVFATTNLPGLDSATVVNANWKDITLRTALSVTGNTAVNTGAVDLSDLISNPDDVLYIAFKYTSVLTTGNRRTWTITNYNVKNSGADFNSVLGNLVDDATLWTRYGNVWNPAARRWTASASSLTIVGGTSTDPNNESWIVSKPMYVGRLTPDIPTGTVKNLTAAATTSYDYIYTAPGVYKASFVFYNSTKDETRSGIKEFNIKVIP